jgi:hypothetical protein
MEGAAAAFEARARGAARDEVFALGGPREGGGEALAPWPHPRGDPAGTRRSRVEGPTEKARLLFQIDLGGEEAQWAQGPIVLPDGTVVVTLDRAAHGGSYLRAFSPDGAPRWSAGLRENISPPVALASGEIAVATPRELLLFTSDGKETARVPLVRGIAAETVRHWGLPVPWNRSLVVGDNVVTARLERTELRGPNGLRLRTHSTIATADGTCYVLARAYGAEPAPPGLAPPILMRPFALHAFGREGELRWTADLPEATGSIVGASRDRILVGVRDGLAWVERATGRVLETRPHGSAAYFALDPGGEPIPLARFGPPLLTNPVVDAAGRRYAAVNGGRLVGLASDGGALFSEPLDLTPQTLTGSLALAPGRLYFPLLVASIGERSIVCFGDA